MPKVVVPDSIDDGAPSEGVLGVRDPVGERSASVWFVSGVFKQEPPGKMIEGSECSGANFVQWLINVTSAEEVNGFGWIGGDLLCVLPEV